MKKKGFKKKRKILKSKKSKGSASDEKEVLQHADPSTLISGTQTPTAGRKKQQKGKKKRSTKSERALKELDKQADKLISDDIFYDSFINRVHQWLKRNAVVVKEMFKCIDVEDKGFVSFDEFKAGMFNVDAPLNKSELHVLCKVLDQDSLGEINYINLEEQLQYTREVRELNSQRKRDDQQLLPTDRKFPECPCCKMSIVGPWKETVPKYILLEMRSVTFDVFGEYPGHLKLLVHSHISVCGLIQMIIAETGIGSSKLAIFHDKTRSLESLLPPDMTLEECGLQGDNRGNPEEATLFYDYTVEFNDCPILLCDHYFGQKKEN